MNLNLRYTQLMAILGHRKPGPRKIQVKEPFKSVDAGWRHMYNGSGGKRKANMI